MFNLFEIVFWGSLPVGLIAIVFFIFLIHNKRVMKNLILSMVRSFTTLFFPFTIFLLGFFYFILVLNFIGLIPFCFPISALVCVSLFFAFLGWLGNYIYILVLNFKTNVAHFLPQGSPGFLAVILVWIEFISWLARPLSLRVRLVANITAGHLLIHLISIRTFFNSAIFFLFFFFVILELVVARVQAYVYTLLLSLYVNEGL